MRTSKLRTDAEFEDFEQSVKCGSKMTFTLWNTPFSPFAISLYDLRIITELLPLSHPIEEIAAPLSQPQAPVVRVFNPMRKLSEMRLYRFMLSTSIQLLAVQIRTCARYSITCGRLVACLKKQIAILSCFQTRFSNFPVSLFGIIPLLSLALSSNFSPMQFEMPRPEDSSAFQIGICVSLGEITKE